MEINGINEEISDFLCVMSALLNNHNEIINKSFSTQVSVWKEVKNEHGQ